MGRKAAAQRRGGSFTFWRIFAAAGCVKVLFWPAYHSTDFEVHRNWLAVTASTAPEFWYADAAGQSRWTLDYPPLFAAFEYALSFPARLVDPSIVDVANLDYAAWPCVAFQRCSVLLVEALFLGGGVAACCGWSPRAALVFTGPGLAALVAVDHVHFQYNGLVLGLFALALGGLRAERHVLAAVAFAALLCLKHLFLTLAPFFGSYLLCGHVLAADAAGPGERVFRFVDLGGAVLATVGAALTPLVAPALLRRGGLRGVSAALSELGSRLFPFGDRGLVHSYWAPNVWALYCFADRVVLRATGRGGGGATRGLVETSVDAGARKGGFQRTFSSSVERS